MEFKIAVDGVVDRVPVVLGPADKRQLPIEILMPHRPIERHAMPLQSIAVVVRVKTVPTPIRVSVVSTGCELQQNPRVLSRQRNYSLLSAWRVVVGGWDGLPLFPPFQLVFRARQLKEQAGCRAALFPSMTAFWVSRRNWLQNARSRTLFSPRMVSC